MKEIINSVGTMVTIVALVLAIVIGSTLLRVLAGIGIVYTMLFHDEYLKNIWKAAWMEQHQKEVDEYNAEVDNENAEVDKENRDVDEFNAGVAQFEADNNNGGLQ